ncbi:MAG: ComEC/Rec2 family competence protein [Verrucomicrobiales bacterium]|nr:ComEC/Rec2 family competence protein [Verrucomicrobiales bacterium]
MRHPLLPVLLWYVAGLLLGWALPWSSPLLFLPAFGLLGVALFASRGGVRALRALLVSMGWLNVTLATTPLSPFDLRQAHDGEPELVRLRGIIDRDPEPRRVVRNGEEQWRTRVILSTRAVAVREVWEPARGRVLAQLPALLPDGHHAGQAVEVYGILRHPAGPVVEGLFDWRQHLRLQGIHFELETRDLRDWRRWGNRDVPAGLPHRFRDWARRTLSRGLPEDEPVRLLWAMVLGWRTGLTDEVAEPFMHSGTMHLFAISGLHVALLAGILVAVLRVLQAPRAACGALVIPLLWFYVAATGWQASAVRATIMMTVVILGWSLRRPSDLLNSLCVAALVILLAAPLQLFRAGFQLSFCVVLTLAVLLPVLEQAPARMLAVDPMLAPELVTGGQRLLRSSGRWALGSLMVSLSAWLGSGPLVAHYFHLVTPVSLGVNVLMVPLGAGVLMSALASLATGAWAAPLAECFNHTAWLGMTTMLRLSETAAELPGAWWQVASPGWWRILLFYAVLFGLVGGQCWRAGRRRWAPWLVGLPVVALTVAGWWERALVRVTIIAPDGGGVVWSDAAGGSEDLLVDCGDERAVDRLVRPLLASRGVNRVRTLALTHGDVRHTGGAAWLVENLPVRTVGVSGLPFRSPGYRSFLAGLTNGDPTVRTVFRGDRLAGWHVLYPGPEDGFPRADDKALVLARVVHGVRLLLLSDLGEAGQGVLLRSGQSLAAEVVVTGIPLNEEPLGPELLARISPRVVVLADAEWPPSRRAPAAVVRRIEASGAVVLPVSQEGAITLELRPSRWELRTMSGRRLRLAAPPSTGRPSDRFNPPGPP